MKWKKWLERYRTTKDFCKKYKTEIVVILCVLLGWFLVPQLYKSNKEIVDDHIHKESVKSSIKQIKINCKMMHCRKLTEENCQKNFGYKDCVEEAKKTFETIKK